MNDREEQLEELRDRRELGDRIRVLMVSARRSVGFSQEQLATALDMSVVTIRRYETGQIGQSISLEFLTGIARLTDRPISAVVNEILDIRETEDNHVSNYLADGSAEILHRISRILAKNGKPAKSGRELALMMICYLESDRLGQLEMARQVVRDFLGDNGGRMSTGEMVLLARHLAACTQEWRAELLKIENR